MKLLAVAILTGLLSAGCVRVHLPDPVVAEGGPAFDPALVGRWVVEKDGEDTGEIDIRAAGNEGIARLTYLDDDGKQQDESYRLVTARLDNLQILSAQPSSPEGSTWFYLKYSMPAPNSLSLELSSDEFWLRAIRDKMVGAEEESRNIPTVTASESELRDFVRGFGTVMFDGSEDHGVLRRVPENSR